MSFTILGFKRTLSTQPIFQKMIVIPTKQILIQSGQRSMKQKILYSIAKTLTMS